MGLGTRFDADVFIVLQGRCVSLFRRVPFFGISVGSGIFGGRVQDVWCLGRVGGRFRGKGRLFMVGEGRGQFWLYRTVLQFT